jgi:CDP-diacylglycerol--serine O-phosphatidyltransferase
VTAAPDTKTDQAPAALSPGAAAPDRAEHGDAAGTCVPGLTAVRMAFEGRWEFAVGAVLVAAVLDGLDGRVARMMKGTSRFGAELDSLADFVNFGVTPALMLYLWILNEAGNLGWIAALIFAISAALRLARFNVALDDPDKPAWASRFFTGVPAPAGALTVLLPLYLEFLGLFCRTGSPTTPSSPPTPSHRLPPDQPAADLSGKTLGTRVRRDYVSAAVCLRGSDRRADGQLSVPHACRRRRALPGDHSVLLERAPPAGPRRRQHRAR